MGTDAIKSLMDYGFSLVIKIKEITSLTSAGGKKVTIPEIFGSLGLLIQIPSIIGDAPIAYKEWLDMDEQEATDLKAYFAAKFDVADEKIEAFTEEVWGILVRVGNAIAILG